MAKKSLYAANTTKPAGSRTDVLIMSYVRQNLID
jgi:hypothetical protein